MFKNKLTRTPTVEIKKEQIADYLYNSLIKAYVDDQHYQINVCSIWASFVLYCNPCISDDNEIVLRWLRLVSSIVPDRENFILDDIEQNIYEVLRDDKVITLLKYPRHLYDWICNSIIQREQVEIYIRTINIHLLEFYKTFEGCILKKHCE